MPLASDPVLFRNVRRAVTYVDGGVG